MTSIKVLIRSAGSPIYLPVNGFLYGVPHRRPFLQRPEVVREKQPQAAKLRNGPEAEGNDAHFALILCDEKTTLVKGWGFVSAPPQRAAFGVRGG